jgi:hypothetical protein
MTRWGATRTVVDSALQGVSLCGRASARHGSQGPLAAGRDGQLGAMGAAPPDPTLAAPQRIGYGLAPWLVAPGGLA